MKNFGYGALVALSIVLVVFFIADFDKFVRGFNIWSYNVQKADDATNYQTKKKVEDNCRAMIANYESDKLIYEQYKDSDDKDEKNWANSAKIRANQTASKYNNYVLQNSFVWDGNIPEDINSELEYIE